VYVKAYTLLLHVLSRLLHDLHRILSALTVDKDCSGYRHWENQSVILQRYGGSVLTDCIDQVEAPISVLAWP
jgi:hypothetical protein